MVMRNNAVQNNAVQRNKHWRFGLGVLSLALVLAGCGSKPVSLPMAHVQKGSVSKMVSASGSLSAVTSQSLGFLNTAKLVELDVKVGDTVRPGQLLAKQDPFSFNVALNQARATLAQQQAALTKVVNNVDVPNARATLDASRRTLEATRRNVDAKDDLDANSTRSAEKILRFAEYQLKQAEKMLRQCREHPPMQMKMPMGGLPAGGAAGGLPGIGNPLGGGGGAGGGAGGGGGPGGGGGAMQQGDPCQSQKTAVTTAYGGTGGYLSAKAAYRQAKYTEDVDHAQGVITIRQAQSVVVQNQGGLDSSRTDRPSNIAAQRAAVANQVAAVANAQHAVDNTILYAPVGGQVSAVTGAVGEYLPGSSSVTTALAPGTDASIPGVGAAATSDQSGNASSGISATRPGGGAFIILNNVNSYQVVVPFEESDASKVRPNQDVEVSFDAVPDLQLPGKVLSIAPNGVNISGVTNYYATILLTKTDPRLKAGQTAEAAVVTNSLDNTLVVPNSAVIKAGGNSYVNVPGPNGQPVRKQFTPGAVGDDNTQVLGGLSEGDQVVFPQASPGAGSGSTTGQNSGSGSSGGSGSGGSGSGGSGGGSGGGGGGGGGGG
jgi:HlyD family secretion protein